MDYKYDVGDMLYNNRDKTYNLILDINRTPSRMEGYRFLYTYLDLELGIPRAEFNSIYEERTEAVP
jgi:hypothetical protein